MAATDRRDVGLPPHPDGRAVHGICRRWTVLATITFATAGPGFNPYDGPLASLTVAQSEQLSQMTRDLTRACVEAAGATFPYGPVFPMMPAGADPNAWDTCVDQTKAAVDEQFAEWGGHLVPQELPAPTATEPVSTATES